MYFFWYSVLNCAVFAVIPDLSTPRHFYNIFHLTTGERRSHKRQQSKVEEEEAEENEDVGQCHRSWTGNHSERERAIKRQQLGLLWPVVKHLESV